MEGVVDLTSNHARSEKPALRTQMHAQAVHLEW
jgi:hypothetical protein